MYISDKEIVEKSADTFSGFTLEDCEELAKQGYSFIIENGSISEMVHE